ncbi:hypothetical protein C3432_01795 [Citrobacter amalonaticus]|uniref:Uncharacterized protein n=1 Tax=Citrobacter amalonaticus TaxID=35703 RepID=A0A2S4S2G7_CITAM|nr:T3SS effector OspC family protein [Citrobacter amalonaticus]POT59479.1 hypothetical protein C3432_01795 [Citrobacter amalonaticus]POT77609.1 hypothetical protein C3436_09465 [Citrobacter amalonaticus]POU68061.1 hypothetical protein C3430_03000 [Citrobacter amalonaticus]POV07665.1 hypothetical protein C3424_03010 [Citrobacter amalonaticus]
MKPTRPLENVPHNNFAHFHPAGNTAQREQGHILKDCTSVHNSQGNISLQNDSAVHASNVIKDFFKKTIAAQSYNHMFSEGANFKKLGVDLAKPTADKAPLSTLHHLDNISKSYLVKIKEKTHNLTPDEKELLRKVVDAKWHFRHQSNSNLSDGHLNILSQKKLKYDGVVTGGNTKPQDIKCLANNDFVFFGVEFSNDEAQLPLNTRHTDVDFGANAYILDDQFPYGYLTLTDHFDNTIPPAFQHEHAGFVSRFSEVRSETYRKVHGEKGVFDVPMYSTKDMKFALGLHLIDFLRQSRDVSFKRFALNENLDSKGLDRVLNFVFQPEFHVPRMVSTTHFKEVKLREISVKEAIGASNMRVLTAHINSKDDAISALFWVIYYGKPDIAEYIFSNFEINREDVMKISPYSDVYDLEYMLSDYSADASVLKQFLARGLIDPNKTFVEANKGSTMLDNAIKYKNQEMINVLLSFGAVTGKEGEIDPADSDIG